MCCQNPKTIEAGSAQSSRQDLEMNAREQLPAHPFWNTPKAQKLQRQVSNPFTLGLYMLTHLPAGLLSGMRVDHVDERHCVTSVPFRWRNQNPFKSTYFAILSMAAELSSGAPAMIAVRGAPESVALIIVGMQADFIKRASTKISFTCNDVSKINAAVEETLKTGEAVTTTSNRLQVLVRQGLIVHRRDDRHRYYRLADEHVIQLLDLAFAHAEHTI